MKKERRDINIFNLSFLDVISCGFGAIILLLVISEVAEPLVVDKMSRDMSGVVRELEGRIYEIRGRSELLNRELEGQRNQLSKSRQRLARLQGDFSDILGRYEAARIHSLAMSRISGQLESAKQKLSEEMRRLQASARPSTIESTIGGVPVDSEYIIFVIDTSGSMQKNAWPLVRKKMGEILKIYPKVKGIQILNDMGDYMFSQYNGRWIPDTPSRRQTVLKRLISWAPFSNSSPEEGITEAIRRFYDPEKKISIYILGDDFSRGSIQSVVDTVDRINRATRGEQRLVRIHAVGFPVLFNQPGAEQNVARFAALMRRLAEDNNGSFVGLGGLR